MTFDEPHHDHNRPIRSRRARVRHPVLIDFWAPWCGPCRAVAPVLGQIADEYAGRLTVVKVNVDEEPGIAEMFAVRSIPTLVVVKGREVVAAGLDELLQAKAA